MAQILDYSPEEMLGMPASGFGISEAAPVLPTPDQAEGAEVSEHSETMLRARDGAVVPVLASARPFFDGGGRYAGSVTRVIDLRSLPARDELPRDHLRVRSDGDGASSRSRTP